MDEFKTTIEHENQAFLDEPKLAFPARKSIIEMSVRKVFGLPSMPPPKLLGYERVQLKWMSAAQMKRERRRQRAAEKASNERTAPR